jgi:hypothetical protein
MSARVKKNMPLLKMLSKAKPSAAKAIIKTADKELVDTLCECGLNVLKGNVRLTLGQKKRLARHKQALRALAQKQTSLRKKKALLQKGGFLGALLSPVLGILGSLFQ